MNFYTVRKNTYYLDRSGYDAFQPVSMTQGKAHRVARQGGGVVEEYRCEVEREYEVPEPVLPVLEWWVVG